MDVDTANKDTYSFTVNILFFLYPQYIKQYISKFESPFWPVDFRQQCRIACISSGFGAKEGLDKTWEMMLMKILTGKQTGVHFFLI